jgi:hypothetical protein
VPFCLTHAKRKNPEHLAARDPAAYRSYMLHMGYRNGFGDSFRNVQRPRSGGPLAQHSPGPEDPRTTTLSLKFRGGLGGFVRGNPSLTAYPEIYEIGIEARVTSML